MGAVLRRLVAEAQGAEQIADLDRSALAKQLTKGQHQAQLPDGCAHPRGGGRSAKRPTLDGARSSSASERRKPYVTST